MSIAWVASGEGQASVLENTHGAVAIGVAIVKNVAVARIPRFATLMLIECEWVSGQQ
jgi:hypothetical protein